MGHLPPTLPPVSPRVLLPPPQHGAGGLGLPHKSQRGVQLLAQTWPVISEADTGAGLKDGSGVAVKGGGGGGHPVHPKSHCNPSSITPVPSSSSSSQGFIPF